MKLTVTVNLNVRVGKPSLNAPCYQYIATGSILEVDGTLYPGDKYDGINTWYKDEAGNYYWSGGVEEINQQINYNNLVLNIPVSWKETNGRGINVAVLDTGVNISHPDFKGIFNSTNAIDFTSSSSGIKDIYNHGTLMAGIIGARSSSNNGITGVAPECNLYILKVGDDDGDFLPVNIINALNWATLNNIHIINMSFSINYNRYLNIVNILNSIQNCIIVAAAGENNILLETNFLYPAMHPQIISVGAINQLINGEFNKELDYILPLLPVTSCCGNNKSLYSTESGSSMSAALLTGVIALFLSCNNKINLQKSTVKQELDKYTYPITNNLELNKLLIIKP
jgi:subtilisin family serine protease